MAVRSVAPYLAALVASLTALAASNPVAAQSARALDVRSAAVIDHWTPERRAAATPRDLVIDARGLGYLRQPGNVLVPYGHSVAALASDQRQPNAAPGGSGDTTGPSVTLLAPAAGATVGATATFSASVSDPSGVRSVNIYVQKGSGVAQSFAASQGAGGAWSVSLSGLTDGSWSWWVVAKDGVKQGGGNATTSSHSPFTVDVSGGGGGGGDVVANAEWNSGGVVQRAAGRLYFEMPANARRTRWDGYVCSGTVVADGTTNRSIILTASHCIYDDANKAFARNVLFIPDQADTTGAGTDLNCSNDPLGCWAPNFGVVDVNWTTRTFPDNVHWDYAFYVVSDVGAHQGTAAAAALDTAVQPMTVSFANTTGTLAYALGYSYDVDPQFMYCTDILQSLDADDWWLADCGLSGGSSGGPWVQTMNTSTGNGPIISVNSWGYTSQPGMAGPKLSGTSASCVFAKAKTSALLTSAADGEEGYTATCTQ